MRHTNRKIVAGLAGIASMFLIAGTTLGTSSASAAPATTDPVVCVVNGAVTITPGVNPPPGNTNTFAFSQAQLNCVGANDDAGLYTNVSASGGTEGLNGGGEDCLQGKSDANGAIITADTPEGPATGTFTFTRTGTAVTVDGHFTTPGETHHFTAELQFTPTTGTCTPGDPVTVASITGTAVITEDAEA